MLVIPTHLEIAWLLLLFLNLPPTSMQIFPCIPHLPAETDNANSHKNILKTSPGTTAS